MAFTSFCKVTPPPQGRQQGRSSSGGAENACVQRLTVCPWKVLTGLSWPSLQTWMHMSVLQEANVLLLCQSTSRAGAVGGRGRKPQDCCTHSHFLLYVSTEKSHLSGTETAASPPPCGRPK